MFKLIISSDRAIQQTQNVIFESLFTALHGVTYVIYSLYLIKIDMTEQSNYFIVFVIAKLCFCLQLSKRYFLAFLEL